MPNIVYRLAIIGRALRDGWYDGREDENEHWAALALVLAIVATVAYGIWYWWTHQFPDLAVRTCEGQDCYRFIYDHSQYSNVPNTGPKPLSTDAFT